MPGGIHPSLDVIASWPQRNLTDPEKRGHDLLIVSTVFGVLSILTVAARCWTRITLTKNFGLDDWIILVAMVPTIGLAVTVAMAESLYGFNRHVWDLTLQELLDSRKVTMAIELLYTLSTGLTKLSILFFYRRLSAGILPNAYIYLVYISLCIVAGQLVAQTVAVFFTCVPFHAMWWTVIPGWDAAHPDASCYDQGAFFMAVTVLSVFTDLLAVLLPALLFWRLQIPLRQKLAMGGVFAVGFFLVAIGVIRCVLFYRTFYQSYDVTWEANPLYAWTVCEALVGTMVASAPALKVLVTRTVPGKLYSSDNKSASTKRNSCKIAKLADPQSQARSTRSRNNGRLFSKLSRSGSLESLREEILVKKEMSWETEEVEADSHDCGIADHPRQWDTCPQNDDNVELNVLEGKNKLTEQQESKVLAWDQVGSGSMEQRRSRQGSGATSPDARVTIHDLRNPARRDELGLRSMVQDLANQRCAAR